MASHLDPRLVELLDVVRECFNANEDTWAIGGALAMRAHGVRRFTDDVDLFVLSETRVDALRKLRQHDLEVSKVFAPHHYVAYDMEHKDPDIRIDVLAPVGDPEESAIHLASVELIEGVQLRVFTPPWIAITKFYSDQPGAIDDIHRMIEAGALDIKETLRLAKMLDEDHAKELEGIFIRLTHSRNPRQRPRGKVT